MVVILLLGVNSGRKSDFFTELVVLLGTVFSAALSMHYYVRLGNLLNNNFVLPPNSHEVLAFIIIAGGLIGITLLVKGGWRIILKVTLKREIDNWGSLAFAFIKSSFLCSLVLFAFLISGQSALANTAKTSYSFIIFRKPALWSYDLFYIGFVRPFFKEEPLNQKAFRTIKEA
jgi:hypothetical protein